MDPHTTPELAAAVVAWHNRHPLAKRLRASQVLGIGVVALPFYSPGAAPLTDRADAVFPAPPPFNGIVAPEPPAPVKATEGSNAARAARVFIASAWGRLLDTWRARWPARWRRKPSRAQATRPSTVPGLRPSFSEEIISPLSPRQVADFALKHGSTTRPGAPEWPQRDVLPEAGTPATVPVVRFVHSAAIELGGARSRLLVGVGPRPQVIGQRLWSRPRILAAAGGGAMGLLLGLVAVIKLAHPGEPAGPVLAAAPAA